MSDDGRSGPPGRMEDEPGLPERVAAPDRDGIGSAQTERTHERRPPRAGERVKELHALYQAARAANEGPHLSQIFRRTAELVSPAWRYPEITRGRVLFDGAEYVTESFEPTRWKQAADIVIAGQVRGAIEVYYMEERPELDEGPFLAEERDLIVGLADILATAVSRTEAEEALRRKSEIVEASHRIANVFLTSSRDDIYSDVLDVILEASSSRDGYFGYIDGEGDLICPSTTSDHGDRCRASGGNIVSHRVAGESGMLGRSLVERRTLIINEGLRTPEWHMPLENAMALPIVHHGAVIGQFVVANKPGGYDEHDRQLLEGAATQTAPILNALLERGRQEQQHKELEEQYRHSQKMEAVGLLAGGVAHDFNNLLTVINSYAAFAMEDLREGDPMRADIREILDAGTRAATLTRQLLAFSRKQVMESKVVDLNEIVGGLEKMLRRLLGADIELCTFLEEGLGKVVADPGQIEQVLMNLAVNARDAMPTGGKLTMETSNVELDEAWAREHSDTSVGAYVRLAVTDDGVGIAADVKARIFEPFYTTKERGHGTGLGLSTVYGIVKQSGGNIWVDSEPGEGTTFEVYLPRVDAEKTEPRRERSVVPHRGTQTILVVEDDRAVRNLTSRILASAGYTAITAANGGEALLECERHGGQIHLVLTDVVMPKMSGRELADRLAVICVDMKVLYMSGYADNAILHEGVLERGVNFIAKPFNAQDLLEQVRMVLEGD